MVALPGRVRQNNAGTGSRGADGHRERRATRAHLALAVMLAPNYKIGTVATLDAVREDIEEQWA